MKKFLLTLLAIFLILGGLGAAGFAGFQYGYRQGALSAASGNAQVFPGRNFGPQGMMPGNNFGFEREFGPRGFGMMNRGGMGFGFLSPFMFLARIAFWALIIWAVYMLVTRSGWRITRTTQTQTTIPQPTTTETEIKE